MSKKEMIMILTLGFVLGVVVCMLSEPVEASGYTEPRIDPEVFAPEKDCSGLAALAPWSGCHQPTPYVEPEGTTPTLPDDPKTPEEPREPEETECSRLLVPGTRLATSTAPETPQKECASLIPGIA